MKTKVSFIKDDSFVTRRMKLVERFFTKIFNDPLFDPEVSTKIKEFLSTGN